MTTGSKWLSTGAKGRESQDWLDALMAQGRGPGLWEWSPGARLVCTSGYLQMLHPLKQWPAQVSVITPASLSQASSLLASLGETTDCPEASRKMSLLGREQWPCFLMVGMGCKHPTFSCLLWALTLGPAFYLPCDGSAGSGKKECNILKRVMSHRLHVVPIFWMHKTGEKQTSCCPQPFGGAKIGLIIGTLICC